MESGSAFKLSGALQSPVDSSHQLTTADRQASDTAELEEMIQLMETVLQEHFQGQIEGSSSSGDRFIREPTLVIFETCETFFRQCVKSCYYGHYE